MNLQQKSGPKFHCGYNWFFLSLVKFHCFYKRAKIKFFALLLCNSTLWFLLHLCSITKDNLWRCVIDIFKRVWINICSNLNFFIFILLKCNSFLPGLGCVCLLPSIARLIPQIRTREWITRVQKHGEEKFPVMTVRGLTWRMTWLYPKVCYCFPRDSNMVSLPSSLTPRWGAMF